MTIDEAIQHCYEVAESCSIDNKQCSDDHIQLASWLTELKMYQNSNSN